MKQKITINQYNELTSQGKDRYNTISLGKMNKSDEDFFWTIGEMIEFLTNIYGKRVDLNQYKDWSNPKSSWYVEAKSMTYIEEELCDALWSACKEVLEK